jgi:RNA polymerase sigma-70 factor (ECF subfamily)
VRAALRDGIAADERKEAPSSWRSLYDRHFPMVHRVAARLGVPDSEIGDVCQEVFLRVYRGLDGFRGEAELRTWLYRIVLREAARAHRSRVVRGALLALLGREPPARPPEPLVRAEAAWDLEAVLSHLGPKHRQVLVLFDLEELTLEQIAVVVGRPLETVRSRLRHARAEFVRLRRLVQR